MKIDKNSLIERIEYLLGISAEVTHRSEWDDRLGTAAEVVSGTMHLLQTVYGSESQKLGDFQREVAGLLDRVQMLVVTRGVLNSIKAELNADLVGDIALQAQAGVFGDFITLARESLDENKDVAAVLVCAALEDALKRFALQNGLEVAQKDMSEVINALKSKGLLKDPQASIVQSYVKLRNKAFHAQWDKIERESVNAAIGFTEAFLLNNFG